MTEMCPSTPAAHFPRRHLAFLPTAILAALLAAGCGGGGAQAKSGDIAANDAALTDADSALAELNRAESEISSLLGAPPAEPMASAAPAAPVEVPSSPAKTPASAPQGGQSQDTAGERLSGAPVSDPCAIACRALASMSRAATHLCGLSGEMDASCTNARERVKNATDRVSARCPCTH